MNSLEFINNSSTNWFEFINEFILLFHFIFLAFCKFLVILDIDFFHVKGGSPLGAPQVLSFFKMF